MMRGAVWPVLVLVLVLVPDLGAVTLEPGTYRMEWRTLDGDASLPHPSGMGAPLKALDPEQARLVRGLRSTNCYTGSFASYTVILDESRGTGIGYDVAYLFALSGAEPPDDVRKAIKLPLKEDLGTLRCDSNKVHVDIALGETGAQVTKRAGVRIEVLLSGDDGPKVPRFAGLTLMGGWFGKIGSDGGECEVALMDRTFNGIYDDKSRVEDSSPEPLAGDSVLIRPAGTQNWTEVDLGWAVLYDSGLYRFVVSKTGEGLEIAPFTGPTGTIGFDVRNGSGRPAVCRDVRLCGKSGSFVSADGRALVLPAGEYRCVSATVAASATASESFAVRPELPARVAAGKTARMVLGGRIDIEIEPGVGTLTVKRGTSKTFRLGLTVAGSRMLGMTGGRRVTVNVRDSRGRIVASGLSDAEGAGNSFDRCTLHFRPDLPLGRYTIGAGFDPGPYHTAIFAKRRLTVVK